MLSRGATLVDERGMTVIEVVIASLLSLAVAGIFMTALSSIQTSVNEQTVRSRANDEVRAAVEQIDREVRSGSLLYNPSLESPSNYSFRILDAPDPHTLRCIQWRIHDRQLLRRTWAASHGATPDPTTVSGWRTVATDIVNVDIGQPAFSLPSGAQVGRTVRVVLVANARPNRHPQGSAVVEQSLTGRNTTRGASSLEGACTPAPTG